MITKAIIEEISEDNYKYRVRVPALHKIATAPGATPTKELPYATICCNVGVTPALKIGEVVFVEYEDSQPGHPVILGVLLRPNQIDSRSNIETSSLVVDINARLPEDTQIGDLSSKQIHYLTNIQGDVQGQLDLLKEKVAQGGGGSRSGILIVDTLPTLPAINTLYILTTNWSLNTYYQGSWHVLGGTNVDETIPIEANWSDGSSDNVKWIEDN